MPLDLFSTRAMTAALEERRAPKTFLLDTFFSKEDVHDTQEVDIDVIRNKRRLAPFVNPLSEGKLVEHTGYATKTIRPPYIKPKMVTTAVDLLKRSLGQSIYSAQSPEQRTATRLVDELATMEDMIIRREEWMAAQALLTGSVTVIGEGLNAVISFGYSPSHQITLTGTTVWTNAACDPLANLRAWKSIATKDSGLVPTDAILGSAAVNAFLSQASVTAALDRLNYKALQVDMNTANLADGVTYVGRAEGLDLWTYEEYFLNDTGIEQPMIPDTAVLLGSRRADCRRHYGAILDLEALVALKRFPKSWITPDPSARWVMVQSAPLPVPHQIDAFVLATVV